MLEHTTVMTADIQGVPPGSLTARCVVLCWNRDADLSRSITAAPQQSIPPRMDLRMSYPTIRSTHTAPRPERQTPSDSSFSRPHRQRWPSPVDEVLARPTLARGELPGVQVHFCGAARTSRRPRL